MNRSNSIAQKRKWEQFLWEWLFAELERHFTSFQQAYDCPWIWFFFYPSIWLILCSLSTSLMAVIMWREVFPAYYPLHWSTSRHHLFYCSSSLSFLLFTYKKVTNTCLSFGVSLFLFLPFRHSSHLITHMLNLTCVSGCGFKETWILDDSLASV